ncbi:hypothetical protein [Arthrobacter sp. Soil736]|uniref:hypothetical protein n=1 Tax=Arthrobacter sp. Soil736 TaxID=1736395 RepID=UPI0012FBEB6F|nr:hypothetical protein [Arthrobacter sp. Soil736]
MAAVTIATALTLNIDQVYVAGDALVGSRNVLDLLANILMVVGIYFLSRAILRAADPEEIPSRRDHFGLAILGLVIVGLIVCFSAVAAPYSSTSFMKDFGDQWSAAVYSAVQFGYIGIVVGITGYTCFRFRGNMSRPYFRIAFTLIGVGCSLAVILVLAVLGMDVLHLHGDLVGMRALSLVYDAALVGAMAFLCAGLALPPTARRISRRRESKTEATLVGRLTEVWEKTTDQRREVRLVSSAEIVDRPDSARRRLHRMLVEIQDALLIDPELLKVLDDRDHQVLNRVEQYLAVPPSRTEDGTGPHTVGRGSTLHDRIRRQFFGHAPSKTRSEAEPTA